MTALSHNPTNKNLLSPLVFMFQIKRAPNVNFHVQSVLLPGIVLDQVEYSNPFTDIPQTGDQLYWEELGIHFKVNENLANWLEIWNWIKNTGFPNSYDEYASLSTQAKSSGLGLKSDISLLISDNNKSLSFDITFKDAIPISLSALQFDSTSTSISYLDAFASFRYVSYDITSL